MGRRAYRLFAFAMFAMLSATSPALAAVGGPAGSDLTAIGKTLSGSGLSAPFADLSSGDYVAGYDYMRFRSKLAGQTASDLGKAHTGVYSIGGAISNSFVLGVSVSEGSVANYFLQYKVSPGLFVLAGNRDYNTQVSYASGGPAGTVATTETKVFYGFGGKYNIDKDLSLHAIWMNNSLSQEWMVGAAYKLSSPLSVNIGYQTYIEEHGNGIDLKMKGVNFGVKYKF
ncbi:MAG: hypothetical protein N2491_02355 [Negativicutes bacterium]|nr:hypothetical protein [Negativicutes bacterium]